MPPIESGASAETVKKSGNPGKSNGKNTANGQSHLATAIDRELGLKLFEFMLRTNLFEERLLKLYRQGELFGGLYTGSGNEAVAIGSSMALQPGDIVGPSHRGIGAHFVRGESFSGMMLQLMARAEGGTKGRDNAAHQSSIERGILGNISHMGAWTPVAAGCGLACKIRGEKNVALSYIGDGSSSLGIFHEILNLAAVLELPFVLIIENNQWAYSTPPERQYRSEKLSDRAHGYGINGVTIDGTDVELVYQTVSSALEEARQNCRPSLIEAVTMRLRGHSAADEAEYVPKELIREWENKHPVLLYQQKLISRQWISVAECEALKEKISAEIEAAVSYAKNSPQPVGHTALADVYAPVERLAEKTTRRSTTATAAANTSDKEVTYIEAIRQAIFEEMRADPRVFCIGEDIGHFGGAFKATKGLLEEFGANRVIDTPIAENAFVGVAIGAAIWGLKPIVEMQFADFTSDAFTQIIYNAAKTHYRSGLAVPLVIRLPVGAGMGAGPFHSANPESWFTNCPGLKIVAPSSPSDARGLLKAALRDNNPVIFLEHKFLYRRIKEVLRPDADEIEIGRARLLRDGSDGLIITYGACTHKAVAAAAELEKEGASVAVLDLLSLLPWDKQTVIESVRRLGRALILHEAPLTGGFGGEIASHIAEHCFEYLDAPVMRLASDDTPVPFAPPLEEFVLPQVVDIVDKMRKLLKY